MELERVFAGRRRAMARGVPSVLGSENFFSGERKIFPWAGNKFFRSKGCKFPIRAGGASCLKTDGPLGAAAVAETGAEGGGVFLFVNIFHARDDDDDTDDRGGICIFGRRVICRTIIIYNIYIIYNNEPFLS